VRRPCYQGKRFTSAARVDCSDELPDICSSTMTKTPAKPPIQDAAITHHAEIIQLPPLFAVRLPEVSPAASRFSLCHGKLIVCLLTDIVMCATSPHFPSPRSI
jgi:hypothetical protein